jgi:glycosyltransferase involved in cell wall biosynthesis
MSQNIAIIIPVYNTAIKLLSRCLASCLVQTFSDFEIVIVNDGSTNLETGQYLQRYQESHPTKIKLHHIKNCGASLARKFGVEQSESDFIFFLDADDFIQENALKLLISLQKKENFDVVVGQFNIVTENKTTEATNFQLLKGDLNIVKSFLTGKLPATLWPNLYKKNLFKDITFFDFLVGEDMVINSQIFTKPNLKVAILKEVVYNYYRHDASLTKSISQKKTKQGYLATLKSLKFIEANSDISKMSVEICINRLNTLYAAIILNSDVCKELLIDVKRYEKNTIKNAISTFPNAKQILFNTIIAMPFLLGCFKLGIKNIKFIKSN